MITSELYQPANNLDWQGRIDENAQPQYIYQTIQYLDLRLPLSTSLPGIALISFNCDLGVKRNQGRLGAHAGPQAIKQALARLPAHHKHPLYDAGSITPLNDDLVAAQATLAEVVAYLLKMKLFPIVLGGGHETAWGHYQGIAKHLNDSPLSIVNFDAHFDLRVLPADNIGTSGTSFYQIAQTRLVQNQHFDYYCIGIQKTANTPVLFEIAQDTQTHYLLAETIYQQGQPVVDRFLAPLLAADTPIYLSICLDVFAACYAPGVSAPQALGLTPWQVIPSLKQLALSGKVVSMDIVELAPNYDTEQQTAKLAAQLLAYFLFAHT